MTLTLARLVAADPCATLSGAEALTCKWKEASEKCLQQKCQDCSGEHCTLCQKNTKLINECCEENTQNTARPLLCKSAALAERIQSCISTKCSGCSGKQCQECQKEVSTISKCCEGDFHDVELPEVCARVQDVSSCQSFVGEERLTCMWEEEVRGCMRTSCSCAKDDTTDACKVCQADNTQISSCCDQHRQSTKVPRMCTDAILTLDVMSCIDTTCSSCEGEHACKLCKEDVNLKNQCCIDHQHGLDPPPMCDRNLEAILP